MREYRKRKRLGKMGTPTSLPSTPSIVRATELSRASRQTIESSGPQPTPPNAGFVRKGARRGFKTALELARTFPSEVLASRACLYCYDTGYSSPGTRCSYCRGASVK
jgi:hypothetical protein